MNKLTVINKGGQLLIDSRDVAEITDFRHDNLISKIRGYIDILDSSKLRSQGFFIENTYMNSQNKVQPHYLLTKKGCDMVANKMTGAKGVLFTAEYVTKFEEMEKQLKAPQLTAKQLLVLDIYEGGIKGLEGHKKLSKIEVDEAIKGLKDGNNKIISCTTVVAMLRIEGLTTTLLNKWFCENGFGEMKKLQHQRNRFFCPNERFEKYVAYEGYSLTGMTINNNKTKVFYSTSMVDRLTDRHMRSIINFVIAERSNN